MGKFTNPTTVIYDISEASFFYNRFSRRTKVKETHDWTDTADIRFQYVELLHLVPRKLFLLARGQPSTGTPEQLSPIFGECRCKSPRFIIPSQWNISFFLSSGTGRTSRLIKRYLQ